MENSSKRFIPALEGVRGYAFIIVFLVHYQASDARPHHLLLYPWFLLMSAGWLVVPLFFALSGYLITQILYDSKGRGGYFRVFYGRRALRVFPLYYLTVFICFAIVAMNRWSWNWHAWGFLFYLQNFARNSNLYVLGNRINTAHFWSLAVEEHFYLVWPVVVYLCASRKQLLRCCYGILIACFAMRIAWPLLDSFQIPLQLAYSSTLTRVDAIICGAIIALATKDRGIPEWLKRSAIVTIFAGLALLSQQAVVHGHSKPDDYMSIVCMTPVANAIATALLILLLCEETWLSHVCRNKLICKLGSLSYGLYVFHFLYCDYFVHTFAPHLGRVCGPFLASLLTMLLAFGLTLTLAVLAYRFIELPGQRAKRYLSYGSPQAPMVTALEPS